MNFMMQKTIWVRPDISPTGMVKQGHYDNPEEAITAIGGFRIIRGKAEEVEALVYAFIRKMTRSQIITELAHEGAKPARPEHLLGFGKAGLDRRFVISSEADAVMRFNLVALGKSVRDEAGLEFYLSLTRFCAGPLDTKRHLKLQASLPEWSCHWHILAVPK